MADPATDPAVMDANKAILSKPPLHPTKKHNNENSNSSSIPTKARRKSLEGLHAMTEQLGVLQEQLNCMKSTSRGGSATHVAHQAHTPLVEVQEPTAPASHRTPVAAAKPPLHPPVHTHHHASAAPQPTPASAAAVASTPAAQASIKDTANTQITVHSVSKLIKDLLHDPVLRNECEQGLNAQLQRTKDGATAETRIQELAGIVRVLRRCLREVMQRSGKVLEQAEQHEATQSIASARAESQLAQLEAEAAHARREVAQAQAALKTSEAKWQTELDFGHSEIGRLRRELQRVELERDKAREDLRGAEVSRLALEDQVRRLKSETGQQLRELQVDKGEAQRSLSEMQAAADKRERDLREELLAAQVRLDSAQHENSCLQQCAASLQQELHAAQAKLRDADAAALQAKQLQQQLEDRIQQLQAEMDVQAAALQQTQVEESKLRTDANFLQDNNAQLLLELSAQQEKASQLAAQLRETQSLHENERTSWQFLEQQYKEDVSVLEAREAALQNEKTQLKGAVSTSLQQQAELQEELTLAVQRAEELEQQVEERAQQLGALQQQQVALQQASDKAAEQLEQQKERYAQLQEEAATAAAKLAQIEGEMEALQGVIGDGDQKSMVSALISKVATLEHSLAEAEVRRRQIHNQLVELRGNIRVFCRIRPCTNANNVVALAPDGTSLKLLTDDGKDHMFSFDRVFAPSSSQESVFQEVSDLVQSALDGYQVCLFSYGQTGAGKTYTMQGVRGVQNQGIIPRAVRKILDAVKKLQDAGWEYMLEASFIEVYNETLRDLLAPGGREAGKITEPNAIRHNAEGGHTVVVGANRMPVETYDDADALISTAAAARAVESTAMNAESSRSHSVFMLYITGRNAALETEVHGALNLVDLAGSERLARSQVEGQRQKEACAINKSLSSLGDVFQALSSKSTHIPYRNSKLTHLLQPCLGGDGKTLMFVNINPEQASAQETLCSLRFAAKINACETGAKGGAKRHTGKMSTGGPAAQAEEQWGFAIEPRRASIFDRAAEDSRRASLANANKRKMATGQPAGLPTAARRKLV